VQSNASAGPTEPTSLVIKGAAGSSSLVSISSLTTGVYAETSFAQPTTGTTFTVEYGATYVTNLGFSVVQQIRFPDFGAGGVFAMNLMRDR